MNKFDKSCTLAAALVAVCFVVGQVEAKPIVYPAKGQSAQQQQKDDGECYVWAKNNTGIDPAAVAATPPPPPANTGGERAKGALVGAAVGGLANGNSGAKTGAAVGIVAGGAKQRQKQKAADAQQQSAQAQSQGAMDTYYRAYSTCMQGRGYTVN